ncbi:MAG: hypothetical protein ACLUFN_00355 [Eubacterium sp.]
MKKQKNSDIIITVIITGMIWVLVTMSGSAKSGAKEGWVLCENIIIPSLLPILILTNIIIKSRSADVFEALFGWLFERLFKLPKCAASAVILGLVGGYPAGAVLTSHLVRAGMINNKTAERIMRFNFSGGVAFTITAVGTVCFGSTKIGIVLYIINIISELVIGIFSAIFCKDKIVENTAAAPRLGFADAMVEAVNTTVKSIAVMCAYIILFSAITSVANLPEYLNPVIEITNGICKTEEFMPLSHCAAFLAFGGFCIHFQLIGILREMKVNYFRFFINRVISSALSYGFAKAYLYFFPQSASVFSNLSNNTSAALSQVNTGLSVVMIVGCAVVIFDIESKKLKLH